jgi:hypothetical protein
MKGAKAELCAKTSNILKSSNTTTIGANQNFFLARISSHISVNIDHILKSPQILNATY